MWMAATLTSTSGKSRSVRMHGGGDDVPEVGGEASTPATAISSLATKPILVCGRIIDLTGEDSEFPDISKMTNLVRVDLSFNKVEDIIPDIGELMKTKLQYLFLTSNLLVGSIPYYIKNSDNRYFRIKHFVIFMTSFISSVANHFGLRNVFKSFAVPKTPYLEHAWKKFHVKKVVRVAFFPEGAVMQMKLEPLELILLVVLSSWKKLQSQTQCGQAQVVGVSILRQSQNHRRPLLLRLLIRRGCQKSFFSPASGLFWSTWHIQRIRACLFCKEKVQDDSAGLLEFVVMNKEKVYEFFKLQLQDDLTRSETQAKKLRAESLLNKIESAMLLTGPDHE